MMVLSWPEYRNSLGCAAELLLALPLPWLAAVLPWLLWVVGADVAEVVAAAATASSMFVTSVCSSTPMDSLSTEWPCESRMEGAT